MKKIKTLTEFAQALGACEEFEYKYKTGWGPVDYIASDHSLRLILSEIEVGNIRIKQKLQEIDMMPFTRNGLDCEFWNPGLKPVISCLQKIDPEEFEPYRVTRDFTWYRFCRPRLDHPFLWSEDIELPEGLVVEYGFFNGEELEWSDIPNNAHLARITGCKEGYCFAGEGER